MIGSSMRPSSDGMCSLPSSGGLAEQESELEYAFVEEIDFNSCEGGKEIFCWHGPLSKRLYYSWALIEPPSKEFPSCASSISSYRGFWLSFAT